MTEQTDAAEVNLGEVITRAYHDLGGLDRFKGWLAAREAAARDRGNLEAYRYVHRLLGDESREVIEEHVASALAAAEARGRELGKFDAMEKALDPDGPLLRQMLARGRAEGEQRWMQLAWNAVRELGFDTDGDPTPSARVGWESGEEFMRMICEARKDHDEAYDEGKRDGAQAVLAAVEVVLMRWSAAMRHPASDPGYSGGAVYRDIERAARAAARGVEGSA